MKRLVKHFIAILSLAMMVAVAGAMNTTETQAASYGKISAGKKTITVGKTTTIKWKKTPKVIKKSKVKWTTSNKKVVKISKTAKNKKSVTIKGMKAGTATITLKYKGKKVGKIKVTVKKKVSKPSGNNDSGTKYVYKTETITKNTPGVTYTKASGDKEMNVLTIDIGNKYFTSSIHKKYSTWINYTNYKLSIDMNTILQVKSGNTQIMGFDKGIEEGKGTGMWTYVPFDVSTFQEDDPLWMLDRVGDIYPINKGTMRLQTGQMYGGDFVHFTFDITVTD